MLKKHTEEGFTHIGSQLKVITATQAAFDGDMGRVQGALQNWEAEGGAGKADLDELRRCIAGKADLPDEHMPQTLTLQAQRRNLPEPDDAPEPHRVRAMRSAASTDPQSAIAADQSTA